MVYTYLLPKDTREIQNFIVSWLNTNLIDPYEQRTALGDSPKIRTKFVYGDDFKLVGIWPKIHIAVAGYSPTKIGGQGETDYTEEEEHQFIIYYHTQKGKRFEFADNGLTLTNEAQVVKYLKYIKRTMKTNMTDFNLYFHKPTFGKISKPKWNPKTSCFVGMMPFVVYTYAK